MFEKLLRSSLPSINISFYKMPMFRGYPRITSHYVPLYFIHIISKNFYFKHLNRQKTKTSLENRARTWENDTSVVTTLFPRATSQSHACMTLATAARVQYPAACCAFKLWCPVACCGVFHFGGHRGMVWYTGGEKSEKWAASFQAAIRAKSEAFASLIIFANILRVYLIREAPWHKVVKEFKSENLDCILCYL